MKKRLLLLLPFLLFFVAGVVHAQEDSRLGGVAVNTEISDGGAGVGDILSVSDSGLSRSAVEYDNKIYGVIVEAPILSVEPKTDNTKAVLTSGEAQVKVTNGSGAIAVGEFITSSNSAGVGQKATQSGYVLGKALAAYDSPDVGLVPVSLEIGYQQIGDGVRGSSGGIIQTLVSDPPRLRLFLAVLVAIIVLVAGVVAFIRVVNSGVAAIGRNPLARATIIRGMFISGSVVIVIMLLGFGAAVAIIILGNAS